MMNVSVSFQGSFVEPAHEEADNSARGKGEQMREHEGLEPVVKLAADLSLHLILHPIHLNLNYR